MKSVTRVYEKTAATPGFRFFGGITLGEHGREDLLAVAGSPRDNRVTTDA